MLLITPRTSEVDVERIESAHHLQTVKNESTIGIIQCVDCKCGVYHAMGSMMEEMHSTRNKLVSKRSRVRSAAIYTGRKFHRPPKTPPSSFFLPCDQD